MPNYQKQIECSNCQKPIARILVRTCKHCKLWFCPECAEILPASVKHYSLCEKCKQQLIANGWRTEERRANQLARRNAYLRETGRKERRV